MTRYAVVIGVFGCGTLEVGGACFAHYERLSAGSYAFVVASYVVIALVSTVGVILTTRATCAHVRRAAASKTIGELWPQVVGMVDLQARAIYAWSFLWVVPALFVPQMIVARFDVPLFLSVLLIEVTVAGAVVATVLFSAPLVLRAVRRGLGGDVERLPPTRLVGSFSRRVIVAVPVTIAAGANASAWITIDPTDSHWALLARSALATSLLTVFALPAAVGLAQGVIAPLRDLRDGTQRINAADYSIPVPEHTADEFGELARSLNRAMDGLADRQRIARENVILTKEVQQRLDEVAASRQRIVTEVAEAQRRVERDLHDGAQQFLISASVKLKSAMAAHVDPLTVAQLGDAADSVQLAMSHLRAFSRGLYPVGLEEMGLLGALQELTSRLPLDVRLSAEPLPTLGSTTELTAYFLVSEALTNVLKHARVSAADVALRSRDAGIEIAISDAGIGIAEAVATGGSGLRGLRDRAEALGGHLEITPQDPTGTVVTCWLPH